jgi:hypothetical protein
VQQNNYKNEFAIVNSIGIWGIPKTVLLDYVQQTKRTATLFKKKPKNMEKSQILKLQITFIFAREKFLIS